MPSKREQKRVVAEGVRALRGRPGWDVAGFHGSDPAARLRDLVEAERLDVTLDEAGACGDCGELRAQGDPSALCPPHLRKAMGLG